MKIFYVLPHLFLILGLCNSCVNSKFPSETDFSPQNIEISPGHFITVLEFAEEMPERETVATFVRSFHNRVIEGNPEEWYMMKIPWQGKQVIYRDVAVPVSLREFEGRLYVIGNDMSGGYGHCAYRYYREEGMVMREISYAEYPKWVAIQNMWWNYADLKSTREHPARVDLTIRANPGDFWFGNTMTASIWWHLMTGTKESQQDTSTPPDEILFKFVNQYPPIRLTQIVPGRIPQLDWTPPDKAKKEGDRE